MSMQVIGAGFGRTGTLSLKLALEQLGFGKCYHMTEVFEHPQHIPIWAAAHRGEAIDWHALRAIAPRWIGPPATSGASSSRPFPRPR